jgi:hypothetical protein
LTAAAAPAVSFHLAELQHSQLLAGRLVGANKQLGVLKPDAFPTKQLKSSANMQLEITC